MAYKNISFIKLTRKLSSTKINGSYKSNLWLVILPRKDLNLKSEVSTPRPRGQ